jgi:outer membrane protein
MKTKILLSFGISFFAAITTQGQITEGKYLLGGSIGYTSAKNTVNSSKNESLYTNIQLGKFIKDNTAAGIIFSYGFSNMGSSNKTNLYNAGLFYRKYKSLAKGFYFFGELDGEYNYSKTTQGIFEIGNNAQRYTSNGGSVSFTPGVSYSIFKKMQIELSMPSMLSVSYGTLKTETLTPSTASISTEKGNSFSASANFNSSLLNNFAIGFKFLLGK